MIGQDHTAGYVLEVGQEDRQVFKLIILELPLYFYCSQTMAGNIGILLESGN